MQGGAVRTAQGPIVTLLLFIRAADGTLRLQAQNQPPQIAPQAVKLMQLGSDAMHQGKPADAERYFRQATIVEPQLADAYLGMGLSQMREGNAVAAEALLGKAIELNPKIAGAHMFLGIVSYQMNKFDAASKASQEEIALQPKRRSCHRRTNLLLSWPGTLEAGTK